jgi:hypothetical protein
MTQNHNRVLNIKLAPKGVIVADKGKKTLIAAPIRYEAVGRCDSVSRFYLTAMA